MRRSSTRTNYSIGYSISLNGESRIFVCFPRVDTIILFYRLAVIYWDIVTWTFFCSRAFIIYLLEAILKALLISWKWVLRFLCYLLTLKAACLEYPFEWIYFLYFVLRLVGRYDFDVWSCLLCYGRKLSPFAISLGYIFRQFILSGFCIDVALTDPYSSGAALDIICPAQGICTAWISC